MWLVDKYIKHLGFVSLKCDRFCINWYVFAIRIDTCDMLIELYHLSSSEQQSVNEWTNQRISQSVSIISISNEDTYQQPYTRGRTHSISHLQYIWHVLYLCIYLSIYLFIYLCMYLCVYACMYVSMYVCMYVCMYVYIYI